MVDGRTQCPSRIPTYHVGPCAVSSRCISGVGPCEPALVGAIAELPSRAVSFHTLIYGFPAEIPKLLVARPCLFCASYGKPATSLTCASVRGGSGL